MIAFVTGGSGLLGSHLVPLLLREFREVRLLLRRGPDSNYPPGVRIIHGDLESVDRIRPAMEGCDAVFHLAACVTRWEKDKGVYDRVNVTGFSRMMELALELKVPRVLYTSTFFALGPSGSGLLTEQSRPAPGFWNTHYDRTKIAADGMVPALRERGLPLIRLYPGVIYGPGPLTEANLVVQMIRDFLAGRVPGLLAGGRQIWSFAHAADVAAGHLAAFRRGHSGDDFVLGGENRSLRQFFELLGRLTRRPPPKRSIPLWVGMGLGAVQELLAKGFGRSPEVTRGMIRAMRHSWACDSSQAVERLGYGCRPLAEGLRETLDWLDEKGMIPGAGGSSA